MVMNKLLLLLIVLLAVRFSAHAQAPLSIPPHGEQYETPPNQEDREFLKRSVAGPGEKGSPQCLVPNEGTTNPRILKAQLNSSIYFARLTANGLDRTIKFVVN